MILQLLRTGAGELVYQAVQAELEELLSISIGRQSRGVLPAREIQTLGPVTVPKVRAKTGEAVTFRSVGAAVREKDEEPRIPWLYLKGLE